MKKITLFTFALFLFGQIHAQIPILTPTMTVTEYLSVNSPGGESISNVIDGNVNTKFLDFNEDDGAGFIVNLGTTALARSIDISTANDAELRDPTMVEIAGSVDGNTFTSITTITIPCITDRFFTRTFDFTNGNAYAYYRINFIQECNDSAGMIQIAEVQLFSENQLGVNEFELEQTVSITPNPNNGIFKINSQKNVLIDNVLIYDITGKVVLSVKGDKEINASQLSRGMYLVKISTKAGIVSKKIIIE
ncbi:T9SS type A sorting domain-containing protein [uncultured Lacinutrix sp.]|uniref:T9SS type A sorting domain-containing protein n=1 Tax=uncultured Lacinutrix sp. TaxID=574032 RepID=UPI002636B608|nr:T9SS type A sorting domain-containing protein [uncultured Lacinutrix sp.]